MDGTKLTARLTINKERISGPSKEKRKKRKTASRSTLALLGENAWGDRDQSHGCEKSKFFGVSFPGPRIQSKWVIVIAADAHGRSRAKEVTGG